MEIVSRVELLDRLVQGPGELIVPELVEYPVVYIATFQDGL